MLFCEAYWQHSVHLCLICATFITISLLKLRFVSLLIKRYVMLCYDIVLSSCYWSDSMVLITHRPPACICRKVSKRARNWIEFTCNDGNWADFELLSAQHVNVANADSKHLLTVKLQLNWMNIKYNCTLLEFLSLQPAIVSSSLMDSLMVESDNILVIPVCSDLILLIFAVSVNLLISSVTVS